MKNFCTLFIGILLLLFFSLPILAQEEKNQIRQELQAVRLPGRDQLGYTLISSGGDDESQDFDPNGFLSGDSRPYQYGIDWVACRDSWNKLGKWEENEKGRTDEKTIKYLMWRRSEMDIKYVVMKTAKMAKETLKNLAENHTRLAQQGGIRISPLKDYPLGNETYEASWGFSSPSSIVFRKGCVIVLIYLEGACFLDKAKNTYNPSYRESEKDCVNFAQLILSRIKAAKLDK
jgi:hypothetical protein